MNTNLTNMERAEVLTAALPYIRRYAGKVVVVKYGGNAMTDLARRYHRNIFLPPLDLTTDNAAMVAVCGNFKYRQCKVVG